MYGVRTDGTPWLYPGQGNGRHAPYTVAGGTNFNGASITPTGIGTPTAVGTTGWLNFQALS
ncbi:hypothetical protein ACGFR8_28030 [Streptomyces brevispora]|uniref:hypothetical protein n=1 Tax=Streptomyces brevispora TaxID=887462 RepID=UPI003710D8D0